MAVSVIAITYASKSLFVKTRGQRMEMPDEPQHFSVWQSITHAVTAIGLGIANFIIGREGLIVTAVILEFAILDYQNAHRPLWFDELFTFYISKLPSLGQVLKALPADGQLPLIYVIARPSLRVFGPNEFALRLPLLVAFAGAALATYWIVRQRQGAVFGIFATLLLYRGPAAYYASEARPYALLLGFTGLTLVCWQAATVEGRSRVKSLIGLGAGIAATLASHNYGLFYVGVPLLFGEAVRLIKRRRFDLPLYGACAAGLGMLVITMPFAFRSYSGLFSYVKASGSFWAKPRLTSLTDDTWIAPLWPFAALIFFLIFTDIVAAPSNESGRELGTDQRISAPHELAAAVGLTLLVPILVTVAWFTTGYFLPRYAIGAAMGFAIVAGFATPLIGRNRNQAIVVVSFVVLLLAFVPAARFALTAIRGKVQFGNGDMANIQAADLTNIYSTLNNTPKDQPIVVASALAYMPLWHYAPPQLRARLYYLADPRFAVRKADFVPELALFSDRAFIPITLDDYTRFVSTHNYFLLFCVGTPRLEWNRDRLLAEGWLLQLVRTESLPGYALYRVVRPSR